MNNELLGSLGLISEGVSTTGLVVLAIILQTVCRTVSQSSYVSVRVTCVVLLTACFVFECQRIEPYDFGEFIEIGVRTVCVTSIFMPFGNILAWLWVNTANRIASWKMNLAFATRKAREKAEEKRAQREEERRQHELLDAEPEPVEDSELFEQAMASAKADFDRECQIVDAFEDLDDFEQQAAIDQARAKMTRRIHEIMQGEY